MVLPPFILLLRLIVHLWISSSSVASLTFQKPTFDPNDATITCEGGAAAASGVLKLTNAHHKNEVSRVTYADKIPLWDSATGNLSDFRTRFSFSISAKPGTQQLPCGISFFLAPFGFPVPTNSAGGYMGLYNFTYRTYSPANKVVNVEFDSFVNAVWDPPFRHVGINNNSISSAVFAPWEVDSLSANPIVVEINYTASTHNLSVSWNYASVLDQSSSLSYRIDLRKVLPEWVAVGFTATTNQFPGDQELLWWDFSSTLEINQKDVANVERKVLLVLLAVPLGFAVAAKVIADGVGRSRKKKETIEGVSLLSINVEFSKGAGPRRSAQVIQEYITEVKVISRLRHRNLVKLIGWCHERGEFLLVYEFMPEGSLDSHLFANCISTGSHPLRWPERYRVALGLASALLYLHEEWEQCVVHRDIKAANVMLDSGFNVKLGDFGLARLVDHELGPQTTRLAGTIGYMSPEYISNGRASKESDVYSFGVVCLEIATGRRVVDYIEDGLEMGLVEWVWELYGNGNHSVAIDGRLVEFDEREVECLMVVGLWCAHPDSSQRASIRQAIQSRGGRDLPFFFDWNGEMRDPSERGNWNGGQKRVRMGSGKEWSDRKDSFVVVVVHMLVTAGREEERGWVV
ncbi:unnamed protein product [Linum tenue]|uniref:Protein kinase domain-containing protein n=1 Tax=Linum tenue TaxID=586396 RepID=A0AAV0L998_9ROSI|nr:unnamed protein product [Linum tenue]